MTLVSNSGSLQNGQRNVDSAVCTVFHDSWPSAFGSLYAIAYMPKLAPQICHVLGHPVDVDAPTISGDTIVFVVLFKVRRVPKLFDKRR